MGRVIRVYRVKVGLQLLGLLGVGLLRLGLLGPGLLGLFGFASGNYWIR